MKPIPAPLEKNINRCGEDQVIFACIYSKFASNIFVMFKMLRHLSISMIVLCLVSCYPIIKKEIREPTEALKKVRYFWPEFQDDMDIDSLELALRRSLDYLDKLEPQTAFTYGPDSFTVEHIRQSLETFSSVIKQNLDSKQLNRELRDKFLLYKAAGSHGSKKVLFTGYFEPVLDGKLEPDSVHRYPIYRKPSDLFKIDLGLFRPELEGKRLMARIDGDQLVPYYTRQDIAQEMVLEGENLEIAWLTDPLDLAILQIQGSGTIRLPTGEPFRVGYSASNGHPYRSIGRYLLDKGYIEPENLSLQTIRSFLNAHPDIKEEILNYNPSYIFFTILDNGPLGNIAVPLTPGRSLALDNRLFPKGALAYISCQMPIMGEDGTIDGWIPFSRFILNQDTGGAIRGAGRGDIFWGSGEYAELAAGHLKHDGELYFLVLKPDSSDVP